MTEKDKLMDRLFNDPTRRLINFNIVRGDGPATEEEICAAVNKSMDESDRRRAAGDMGDGPVRTGRPRVDLRGLIAGL